MTNQERARLHAEAKLEAGLITYKELYDAYQDELRELAKCDAMIQATKKYSRG